MHYKIHCDVTNKAIINFTKVMLQAYEENKNRIESFKKRQKNKGSNT